MAPLPVQTDAYVSRVTPLGAQRLLRCSLTREEPTLLLEFIDFFVLTRPVEGRNGRRRTGSIPFGGKRWTDEQLQAFSSSLVSYNDASSEWWQTKKKHLKYCRSGRRTRLALEYSPDPVATRVHAWAPLVALPQHCLRSGSTRSPTTHRKATEINMPAAPSAANK